MKKPAIALGATCCMLCNCTFHSGIPPVPPPSETAKEKATSTLFPDYPGIELPDFRYAGVPGGIPSPEVTHRLSDFGGFPDDEKDDTEAFRAAAKALDSSEGGVLELAEGRYILSHPLRFFSDNTVIRGQGRGKTFVDFKWKPARRQVEFYLPEPDVTHLRGDDWIMAAADPSGMVAMRIFINGREVASRGNAPEGTGEFTLGALTFQQAAALQDGENVVRLEADWFDGTTHAVERRFTASPTETGAAGQRHIERADPTIIKFVGDRFTRRGESWSLQSDLERGQRVLELTGAHPFKVGDALLLKARSDDAFLAYSESARKDIPRHQMFRVDRVEGNRIILNQPARQIFPARVSEASISYPIRNCGVEGLTLKQFGKLWMNGIFMEEGWGCWIRDVEFDSIGRSAVSSGVKFGEVRDVYIHGPGFRAGGGTGYFGNGAAWDCLSENIEAEGLRHGPNQQWGGSGNVVRNSRFIGSDAQYHMGWTLENLYENVIVDAKLGTGAYGHGLYAQYPETAMHGPGGGPRNVVYNCDFKAPYHGAYLGGSNYGWIIAYNRFVVETGSGFLLRRKQVDNALIGNTIVVTDPARFAIQSEELRAENLLFAGNHLYGSAHLVEDPPPAGIELRDNLVEPASEVLPPRPSPVYPSLFEWQRQQPLLPRVINGGLEIDDGHNPS